MDQCEEKDLGSTSYSSSRECSGSEERVNGEKSCEDCRTTKTPLWRGGPSGPKSLCNACGIRYRKKRRVVTGFDSTKIAEGRKEKRVDSGKLELSVKLNLYGFSGGDVPLRDRFLLRLNRSKLREEEEAAFLLMALSSGFL